MATSSEIPAPALLMRRMTGNIDSPRATVSRTASDPLLRFRVEAGRGNLLVQLAGGADGTAGIQWTQNGRPIEGQTGPFLHLAGLTPDDTDLYHALIRSAAGEVPSQSFLVVVVPGHTLVNWSARGQVSAAQPLIGGFVVGRGVGPVGNKRYLLRAVGPTLARFGVVHPVAHPTLSLMRRGAKWEGIERIDPAGKQAVEWQKNVGAFALDDPAAEFVAVASLPPGPYSIVATGEAGATGEVLVEIYELP